MMLKQVSNFRFSEYFFSVGRSSYEDFKSVFDPEEFELSYTHRILSGGKELYLSAKQVSSFVSATPTGSGYILRFFLSEKERILLSCSDGKARGIAKVEFAFWKENPICPFYIHLTEEEFLKSDWCTPDMRDFILFNIDKFSITKNEDEKLFPCFSCGRLMELAFPTIISSGKKEPISGGTCIVDIAGYGSIFDGNKFKVTVCDICMLDSIMSGRTVEYLEG